MVSKATGANDAATEASQDQNAEPVIHSAAQWDPSYEGEDTNWYAEYVNRHAPMSFQWLEDPHAPADESDRSDEDEDEYDGDMLWSSDTPEVKGMGLLKDWSYDGSDKIVAPLDDGSICLWDLNRSMHREDRLLRGRVSGLSNAGLLTAESLSGDCSASGGKLNSLHFVGVGDCVSIDSARQRAYVAVGTNLREVDLQTLQMISSRKYPWSIFALSQETSDYDAPLTVATTLSLNLYDSRRPTSDVGENQPLHIHSSSNTTKARLCAPLPPDDSHFASLFQPGPLSVSHTPLPDMNSIILAGRFPSILLYDRRSFPRLQGAAHSGARLCSSVAISTPPQQHPPASNDYSGHHTVVACGEYNGRGSLEVFAVSAMSQLDYGRNGVPATLEKQSVYKNRQSASRSKLLSVASHGTRLVYSDAEGNIKWVERDARTPVRSWNINTQPIIERDPDAADFNPSRGAEHRVFTRNRARDEGTDVVRKILPTGEELENDEILVWTGDRIGRLRFSPISDRNWPEDDESVRSIMGNRGPRHRRRRPSTDETRREKEYANAMEQSLRAHAYQLSRMPQFGFGD